MLVVAEENDGFLARGVLPENVPPAVIDGPADARGHLRPEIGVQAVMPDVGEFLAKEGHHSHERVRIDHEGGGGITQAEPGVLEQEGFILVLRAEGEERGPPGQNALGRNGLDGGQAEFMIFFEGRLAQDGEVERPKLRRQAAVLVRELARIELRRVEFFFGELEQRLAQAVDEARVQGESAPVDDLGVGRNRGFRADGLDEPAADDHGRLGQDGSARRHHAAILDGPDFVQGLFGREERNAREPETQAQEQGGRG